MDFLSAIPVIGKLFDKGLDIIDEAIEDKDLANKLKAEFNKIKLETSFEMEKLEVEKKKLDMEENNNKRDLLGKAIKNRAIPMKEFYYVYLFLVVFNNVLVPIVVSLGGNVPPLELPSDLTSIINMMTGTFFTYHGVKKVSVLNKKK